MRTENLKAALLALQVLTPREGVESRPPPGMRAAPGSLHLPSSRGMLSGRALAHPREASAARALSSELAHVWGDADGFEQWPVR